ncbi:hypothetical protein PV04_10778 [Phialophora macrospora]|uniref:Zn(2)-C6 fungal-type domain-containing protein n=1 Tax=Phialophora macrospora TaxID=1851006 RepID=A0A0D2F6Q4_9EURO|nr:hypothetical protein PV04_10778 [Phialophora macrospora]
MAEGGSDRGIKRRRVTVACESCRRLKAKCDGKQPVCNRRVGYGHSCVWNAPADNRSWRGSHKTSEASFNGADGTSRRLLDIIASYDGLVEDLRQRLNEDGRRAVAVTLANLRQTVPSMHNLGGILGRKGKDPVGDKSSPPRENLATMPQRYLGEASEVRFLHIMKQTLSGKAGPHMMQGLKETRSRVHLQLPKDRHHQQQPQQEQTLTSLPVTSSAGVGPDNMTRPDSSVLGFYEFESQGQGGSEYMGFAQGISEPVMWSAQFVDAAYNPFLGYSSAMTL